MRDKSATADANIAAIAARQHGVISTRQLLEAGLGRNGISRRTRRARLHRLHQGVYAVGHAGISDYGKWMAAALACGEGAAVSHRSAAVVWGLLDPIEGPIDVSVSGTGGRRRRLGIRLHRCPSLLPGHLTRRLGVPVTTPSRTIADLRGTVSAWECRRATRQAEVLGLSLGLEAESDRTRSDLEWDFLRLCRQGELPAPAVNVRVDRFLVDFLWRDRRLIVETDGYRYHRGRGAFEDDRARDLAFKARGFEVIRLSGRQVSEDPESIVAALRPMLAPPP